MRVLNKRAVTGANRSFHLVMQPSKHDGRISCAESPNLFIRNIPLSTAVSDIRSLLSTYGTLVSSACRPDNLGAPVWVVYAEYDCVTCARNTLSMLHGNTSCFGGDVPLLAKFADSSEVKDERRRRREAATSSGPAQLLPQQPGGSPPDHSHVKRSTVPPQPWTPISGQDSSWKPNELSPPAPLSPAHNFVAPVVTFFPSEPPVQVVIHHQTSFAAPLPPGVPSFQVVGGSAAELPQAPLPHIWSQGAPFHSSETRPIPDPSMESQLQMMFMDAFTKEVLR
jgi:hypothetical protein